MPSRPPLPCFDTRDRWRIAPCRGSRLMLPGFALLGHAAAAAHDVGAPLQLGRHAPLLDVGFEAIGMLGDVREDAGIPGARRAEKADRAAGLRIDPNDAAERLVAARACAVLGSECGGELA